MTYEYYINECQRLREVLAEARERGDYQLEMDIIERLYNLKEQHNEETNS